jgi:hypothetical protein
MDYSHFTIAQVQADFQLTIDERQALFTNVQPVQPSSLLTNFLAEYLSLAIDINSEKARSEFVIAPVLADVRRHSNYQVSLFSGKEFNVDKAQGLTGYCDLICGLRPKHSQSARCQVWEGLTHATVSTVVGKYSPEGKR